MANPPITIGPFAGVPAPGSPIRSDWSQEISQWVVDNVKFRFFAGFQNVGLDANGQGTINHGLTTTPLFVLLTPQGNTSTEQFANLVVFGLTSTLINVRAYRNDNGTPIGNQGIGVSWLAGAALLQS